METTIDNYIKAIGPFLSKDLILPEQLLVVEELARKLPPSPMSFLEFRLGQSQDRVDFQIAIPNAILLNPELMPQNLLDVLSTSHSSEFIKNILVLESYIGSVFLEFDLYESFDQSNPPCFFVSLNEQARQDIDSFCQLAFKFFYASSTVSLQDNLSVCNESLYPLQGKLVYMGFMLSRPNKPTRLVIEFQDFHKVLEYLSKIGHSNVAFALSSIQFTFKSFIDYYFLSFDIDCERRDNFGLECFLSEHDDEGVDWSSVLDKFVNIGLCTKAKREALLNWPGLSQKYNNDIEVWPDNLAGGDLFLGANVPSVLWREINHLKIVYNSCHRSLLAKAYLSFGHSWINPEDIDQVRQ